MQAVTQFRGEFYKDSSGGEKYFLKKSVDLNLILAFAASEEMKVILKSERDRMILVATGAVNKEWAMPVQPRTTIAAGRF